MTGLQKRLLVGMVAAVATVIVLEIFEAWNASPQVALGCWSEEERIRIRNIVASGIDEALKEKVKDLFNIWVTDPHEQPRRAKVGLQQALSAHTRALHDAHEWSPPTCEGTK